MSYLLIYVNEKILFTKTSSATNKFCIPLLFKTLLKLERQFLALEIGKVRAPTARQWNDKDGDKPLILHLGTFYSALALPVCMPAHSEHQMPKLSYLLRTVNTNAISLVFALENVELNIQQIKFMET